MHCEHILSYNSSKYEAMRIFFIRMNYAYWTWMTGIKVISWKCYQTKGLKSKEDQNILFSLIKRILANVTGNNKSLKN